MDMQDDQVPRPQIKQTNKQTYKQTYNISFHLTQWPCWYDIIQKNIYESFFYIHQTSFNLLRVTSYFTYDQKKNNLDQILQKIEN